MKWWGWGEADKKFPIEDKPAALDYLNEHLGVSGKELSPPASLDEIRLKETRCSDQFLKSLSNIVGANAVAVDKVTRLHHALGKSYRDLVLARRAEIPNPPDAVVFPSTVAQIQELLRLAADHRMAIVPVGGGTSVVGGIEPIINSHFAGSLSLNLGRMNQLIDIDEPSLLATVQPGVLGPALESALNARGFTLNHFPQSFEFSTLGGWIAARSAGQTSTRFGKIEDKVISLDLAAPSGILHTAAVPASAAGPEIKQMLIGSEGIFGIITEARMRIERLAEARHYRGLMFKSFSDGAIAIREMVQAGLAPAVVRLSDTEETQTSLMMRGTPASFVAALKQDIGLKFLEKRGYGRGAVMILGFEDDRAEVKNQVQRALNLCKRQGAFDLGTSPGRAWVRDRFEYPYLRDWLLDRRVLVETLETATIWSNLLNLHAKIKEAITNGLEAFGVKGLVMAHISHAYRTGASLYFTFLARQVAGSEIEQWQHVKKAATDCIVANGGTISHHHGVGYDHAAWMAQEHGTLGVQALRALKHALDPSGIMNPGKLI